MFVCPMHDGELIVIMFVNVVGLIFWFQKGNFMWITLLAGKENVGVIEKVNVAELPTI